MENQLALSNELQTLRDNQSLIPSDLKEDILAYVENHKIEIDFDYRDTLSDKQIEKLFSNKRIIEGLYEIGESIMESNLDYQSDLEYELVKEVIKEFELDEDSYEHDKYEDFIEEVKQLVYDNLEVNYDFDSLLKDTDVNVVAVLYSNYDCQSSNYCSTYSYEPSYFQDMIDFLNINPQEFKKLAKGRLALSGNFPNIKSRTGKSVVDINSFIRELENNSSPSLFIFVNRMSAKEAIDLLSVQEKDNPKQYLTVKKGTMCGLFCHWQGGGSMMECEVIQDSMIKTYKDKYTYVELDEEHVRHSYTLSQVYGCYDSIYANGGFQNFYIKK